MGTPMNRFDKFLCLVRLQPPDRATLEWDGFICSSPKFSSIKYCKSLIGKGFPKFGSPATGYKESGLLYRVRMDDTMPMAGVKF
jgi:hypothetical protein